MSNAESVETTGKKSNYSFNLSNKSSNQDCYQDDYEDAVAAEAVQDGGSSSSKMPPDVVDLVSSEEDDGESSSSPPAYDENSNSNSNSNNTANNTNHLNHHAGGNVTNGHKYEAAAETKESSSLSQPTNGQKVLSAAIFFAKRALSHHLASI